MALGRRSRDRHIDYWPGFVDALSTLLLVFTFLLSVFMLTQFFLTQEMSGKDDVLQRLQSQIRQLTELLSLERSASQTTETELAGVRASLEASDAERDHLRGQLSSVPAAPDEGRARALSREVDLQKDVAARAAAQIELLNQQISALRRQMAALEEALNVAEKRDVESQTKISDLGRRLNVALAQRVQELTRFRSEFFGRLREILGNRPDVRVVGDRFVFQSEVFFDPGSATPRPEARAELDKLAGAILELEKSIPSDVSWALRIDGHTDNRPIATAQFPTNWELSAARAIAVVQYLIGKGVSPQHLIAAGFGEYQPIDTASTDEARARNRRIELKLTER
ncbi:peptidoglycan -binding protein [Xanthobacter dioxanivorans]|uniref:Peptidoglycan -binding protein n=1 Tax=Xanthobacter dioxanivorans TaxID=2528964 RepID=A0A974PNN8_9HYPH|nr:peptidoglycan -binding protein [Xanthobacter dioxanivorans]QRG06651.1 peptidoglycan -binding protein [Xanthobacter dioxanivorans]